MENRSNNVAEGASYAWGEVMVWLALMVSAVRIRVVWTRSAAAGVRFFGDEFAGLMNQSKKSWIERADEWATDDDVSIWSAAYVQGYS